MKEMVCVVLPKDPNPSIFVMLNSSLYMVLSQFVGKRGLELIIRVLRLKFISRLKDHRPNLPMRSVVSRCSGPISFIENVFVTFMKEILLTSNRIVTSTEEFIHKIKYAHITSDTLFANLDIVSLYPSIDTEDIINSIGVAIENRENVSSNIKISLKVALNYL